MNLAETKYPIIEKECMAAVWGIRCFKLYLAGKRFTLQTDHKPPEVPEGCCLPERPCVWVGNGEDTPGKENIGTDFWSRLDILVNGQTFIHIYLFLVYVV